jgi:hypothetical protein
MSKTLVKSPFFIEKKGRDAVLGYAQYHRPITVGTLVAGGGPAIASVGCSLCDETAADPLSLVASGSCTGSLNTEMPAPPLILNEKEAGDCGALATLLRDLAAYITAGKGIPAKDRSIHLIESAEMLERVFVAHYPPGAGGSASVGAGAVEIRVLPAPIKRTWRGASVDDKLETVPPHYEDLGGFIAEAFIDEHHTVKSDRQLTPVGALSDLTQKLEGAFKANLLKFLEDGKIVPF